MLQRELQEKTNDMNAKMQQIERSHPNAALSESFFFFKKDLQDSCRTAEGSSEVSRIYFEDADPFGFVQIVYTQQ